MLLLQRLGLTTVLLVATVGVGMNWPTGLEIADYRSVILLGLILALPASILVHTIAMLRGKG